MTSELSVTLAQCIQRADCISKSCMIQSEVQKLQQN
jgi:hypothetical protein